MACFIVPATEAVVTTVIANVAKNKEKQNKSEKNYNKISFSRKLSWLNNMLWGGSLLLAFEHVWHGEITPFFPFLTAANNVEDTMEMLHEMMTVGTSMAALVTAVWIGMMTVCNCREKAEMNHESELVKN